MESLRRDGVSYGLLLIRIAVGVVLILHGAQKVFGAFDGPGLTGFATSTAEGMGVPLFIAYLAAFFEFLGGALLLIGVATEVGAAMTACVMLGAVTRHWPAFFTQNGGFEYAFVLLLGSLALILAGPGRFAIWDPFRRWRAAPAHDTSPDYRAAPVESGTVA